MQSKTKILIPLLRSAMFSLICLLVLLSEIFSAALAQQGKLVIPIYYATERILDIGSSELTYTDGQISGDLLSYGVKNVDQSLGENPVVYGDRTRGLEWWSKLPSVSATDLSAQFRSKTLTKQEFLENIKNIVSDGPSKRPLIVYVHGCCASYPPGLEASAQLEKNIQAPVLLYSWAAIPPTTQKYRENEIRQKDGTKRFVAFLEELEKVVPPERTILVAHSMGNRFLYEAMRIRYFRHGSNTGYPKYQAIAFTAADVQLDDFISDEKDVAFNSNKIWITSNDSDPALSASSFQRGFYDRLGAPKGKVVKLITTDGVEVYKISEIYHNSHALPSDVISQLILGLEGGFLTKYKIQQNKQHYFSVLKK